MIIKNAKKSSNEEINEMLLADKNELIESCLSDSELIEETDRNKLDTGYHMTIIVSSNINADGCIIIITDSSDEEVDRQEYHYGYNASHSREWASFYKDKPFIGDIVSDLCKEYNIDKHEIIFTSGNNVFTGNQVSDKRLNQFISKILNEELNDVEDIYDLLMSAFSYKCQLTVHDISGLTEDSFEPLLSCIKDSYDKLFKKYGDSLKYWSFYDESETTNEYKVFFKDGTNKVVKVQDEQLIEINESYWIDNKTVMDEVKNLGNNLEADGWKDMGSRYSGSKYYDFYGKKDPENKAVFKAIKYGYDGAEIIDITYRQFMGMDPIDNFEGLRKKLGSILLPNNESYDENDNPERCEQCNTLLTDSGECPKCDLGEEDIEMEENLEKMLNEAPVIKLNSDDIMNSDGMNLKDVVKRAEKEEQEVIKQKEIEEFKSKYTTTIDKLMEAIRDGKDSDDILELLFEDLVPSSGMADSVAGEYVRAIMRIMYRDYNDGDVFYEGYGIETAGSSAEYLYDNGFNTEIDNILNRAPMDEDDYTAAIHDLGQKVVQVLADNHVLFGTKNTVDSRDYSTEYIVSEQPIYEFEFYGSDDIHILVEEGILDSWALREYVENILSYNSETNGCEIERPWGHHDTTVTVSNLTKDGLEFCENDLFRDVDSFWEDLVDEYRDELDRILNDEDDGDYEDEDYDDDIEDND